MTPYLQQMQLQVFYMHYCTILQNKCTVSFSILKVSQIFDHQVMSNLQNWHLWSMLQSLLTAVVIFHQKAGDKEFCVSLSSNLSCQHLFLWSSGDESVSSHRICRYHRIVTCSGVVLLQRGRRHRLQEWTNLMRINKDNSKLLPLDGRTDGTSGSDQLGSSSCEKDMGASVDHVLSVGQQFSWKMASSSRQVIFPLYMYYLLDHIQNTEVSLLLKSPLTPVKDKFSFFSKKVEPGSSWQCSVGGQKTVDIN